MVWWCFLYFFFFNTNIALLIAYHSRYTISASTVAASPVCNLPTWAWACFGGKTRRKTARAFVPHVICCWRSSFFFFGHESFFSSIGLLSLLLPLVLSFRPLESPLRLLPRPCVHNECGSIFLYKYTTRNLPCRERCHAQRCKVSGLKSWCVQHCKEGLKAHYLRLWAWMPSKPGSITDYNAGPAWANRKLITASCLLESRALQTFYEGKWVCTRSWWDEAMLKSRRVVEERCCKGVCLKAKYLRVCNILIYGPAFYFIDSGTGSGLAAFRP